MKKILFCVFLFTTAAFAKITVSPYLQAPAQTSMTILWWTDTGEADSRLMYGEKELRSSRKASNIQVPSMKMWLHEATLTGLRPGVAYRCQAVSGRFSSSVFGFRTAPGARARVTFAVLGDGRTDNDAVLARHRAVVTAAMADNVDFILECGDLVKNGAREHWDRFLTRILPAAVRTAGADSWRVPYLGLIGNHEIYSPIHKYNAGEAETIDRFKAVFANPPNRASNPAWSERYYSFRYGSAAFIVLDANNDANDKYDNHKLLADGATPDWSPGSEQYNWMTARLAEARKECAFTFVCFHPSPYCRGGHGNPADKQSGYQLRALEPVFREYGVDAVFSSHDHVIEHCVTGPAGFEKKMDVADERNLNWFVSGNSGQASRKPRKNWESWMSLGNDGKAPFFTRYFYSWPGRNDLASFLLVTLEPKNGDVWEATFEVMRTDGKRFDKTVLQRRAP
jgi:hypothetical protein